MTVVSFNNNNTWTPTFSGIVQVEAWGAGGGGGSTSLSTSAGGGGGGGAYARMNLFVVAGQVYNIQAPPGGANGGLNANGTAGGASFFGFNAGTNGYSVLVRAAGGGAGIRTNAAGAAGTVANSNGTVAFVAGNGAPGVNATGIGGGGGAGGGNQAKGANASGATGGTGANGGGAGGTGGASGANGTAGSDPGGGGGGGGNNVGTARYGGAGGKGTVQITYDDTSVISGKVTIGGANLAGAKVIVIATDDNDANNAYVHSVQTSNAQGNWNAAIPAAKVVHSVVQHNNIAGQYTTNGAPFVVST